MIAVPFTYERAATLDEALAKLGEGGKVVAGGHSLVPLMKLRLSEPGRLIDIARIPGLSGIRERNGRLEVGATTVHHALATSPLLRDACPILAEAAGAIGDAQVRHRGTLGGSLAHADPAADLPAVMLALDAELEIRGPGGTRTVHAADFFQGFYTVDLQPTEIITAVRFAAVKSGGYAKLHQRASHYAIVGIAAVLRISGGVIESARVGVTGATTHAVRLTAVEHALAGQTATPDTIARASSAAGGDLADLNSDLHASAEYRRAMIPVFTRRALLAAAARAA